MARPVGVVKSNDCGHVSCRKFSGVRGWRAMLDSWCTGTLLLPHTMQVLVWTILWLSEILQSQPCLGEGCHSYFYS